MSFKLLRFALVLSASRPLGCFPGSAPDEKRLLYVAVPGIRNYVDTGASGSSFSTLRTDTVREADSDAGAERRRTAGERQGHRRKRGQRASVCEHAQRVFSIDLRTERILWNRTYDGGCDRMAIARDGKTLYVPSFEGPHWHVVDAATGDVISRLETNSGAHNTTVVRRQVRLSRRPEVAHTEHRRCGDARGHQRVGPFVDAIRPSRSTAGRRSAS